MFARFARLEKRNKQFGRTGRVSLRAEGALTL
jgi:hypothetical protein